MDTKRTLYEIEVALSKTDKFNYNVVFFNPIKLNIITSMTLI